MLEDLLNEDLTKDQRRAVIGSFYSSYISGSTVSDRSTTHGPAKSITEFYSLVSQALTDYQNRMGQDSSKHILFTEEEPDTAAKTESIVFSLRSREPGAFSRGAPFKGKIKNQRPLLREEIDDPDNPGYRLSIVGYYYDNLVRFSVWGTTNKAANARALWFEEFMEEYTWWYRLQGVNRVLFSGRQSDVVTEVNDNKWYGRPIDYFVRTERVQVFSEKALESVVINLSLSPT